MYFFKWKILFVLGIVASLMGHLPLMGHILKKMVEQLLLIKLK